MHRVCKGNMPLFCRTGKGVLTSLQEIGNKARMQPKYKFRNLYGMIDKELLYRAWLRLNKKAAAGIDQEMAVDYGKNLEDHLEDLVSRLKRNGYRAKLVKRKYIPKGEGKTRPLGIPVLEDRLLQKAVAMILEAIYEQTFLDCSYGYRPGKSPKMAVNSFRDDLNFGDYNFVVEADIRAFFDNLDHEWLVRMLEERINDQKLIRLIRKWLRAGILEPEGMVIHPLTGTPQGGIVSPILANIYLHYVLDLWVEKVVKPKKCKGKMILVRFADDFVGAFKEREDAEYFYTTLPDRLNKFNLQVADEKTRILPFSRWGKKNKRFNFLGFELRWGKSRSGEPNVKRRTARKKLRQRTKETTEWIKENRHKKTSELIEELNVKLKGHYLYYGVIGNSKSLSDYLFWVTRALFKWLNRRSQKKSLTWKKFSRNIKGKLQSPRVMERSVQQTKIWGIQA